MTKFDAHKWIKDFKSGKLNEDKPNVVKAFGPGDMWSNNFDYVGMLKFGAERGFYELGLETLKDLYESFTDVNYHTEAADLGNAIDYMEDPGQDANQAMERIEDFLARFRAACMKTLKDMKVKWKPSTRTGRNLAMTTKGRANMKNYLAKRKPQMGTGTSGGFRVG